MQNDSEKTGVDEKRVKAEVDKLRKMPIISKVLSKLEAELPDNLYYHNSSHTDDVLKEAVLFSLSEGLAERDVELLSIAAAYHDAGFVNSPVDNEEIGAIMAKEAMEGEGSYSEDEIETVVSMIRDTRLLPTPTGPRQVPTTDLSRYLLDADLSNFGREDFFEKGELQLKELGCDRSSFVRRTYELITNHQWLTNAARTLRHSKKLENVAHLKKLVDQLEASDQQVAALGMGIERLGFLAKLPLLLNSSLDTQRIIEMAIDNLKKRLIAEKATVFMLDEGGSSLTFWALDDASDSKLRGSKMPADKGIVGWVIEKQTSVLVRDAKSDPRFFDTIDQESGFETRDVICVPLLARGERMIGAVQVLNRLGGETFTPEDSLFVEQFANQVALAIDNARLFQQLKSKSRKLEELTNRRREMITVIAHEFRTPLGVIQTSSDVIQMGLKDEEQHKKISETLGRGVKRLTRLVSEVKNLSLLDSETISAEVQAVNVREMFELASEPIKVALKNRNLKFDMVLPESLSAVKADPGLLMLALQQLLSNAIRYTEDGGTIILEAKEKGGMIEFVVKDSGIGIDETQIPLIFEKFYEVRDALQHSSGEYEFQSGGLGLGLSTVRAVMEAHKTQCEVESTPGEGSVFKFSLPVAD